VNDAILHAIFGDGCAVAVVGGRTARSAEPGSLAVLDNRSWLVSSLLCFDTFYFLGSLWCLRADRTLFETRPRRKEPRGRKPQLL